MGWIKRYILFHDKRHPATWERNELEAFPQLLGDSAERKCNPESGAFRCCSYTGRYWRFPCRGWTMSCGQRNRRGYRQS